MKRYIEIVFDDSGSMNERVDGKPKHITAKKLFENKIIPKIDLKRDDVFLRTLSSSCDIGFSNVIKLPTNIIEVINIINSIQCNSNTPLYHTIKDSIDACIKSGANEKHIFILTDGDDTCVVAPDKILGKDYLKIKDQLKLNTILVQFAISDLISQNNLSAFSQRIGATNVIISSNDFKNNFELADKKISKAFRVSGLDKKNPFPHCFESIEGDSVQFEILEIFGEVDYYLVELLHKEGLLSWKPNKTKDISPTQKAELDFLYTLRFRNQLPESQVKQMLSQLKKPYYYSFDCIYWNFSERVWKYFDEIPRLEIFANPNAQNADGLIIEIDKEIQPKEEYNTFSRYRVSMHRVYDRGDCSFQLDDEGPQETFGKILRDGDIISFKK